VSDVSDHGAYRLVARREFVERLRDRGFQVSTGVTLVLLVFVIIATSAGRGTRFDLGVVGREASDVGRQVRAAATALGIEVDVRGYATDRAATAAAREGEVDAAVLPDRIVVKAEPPAQLVGLVQAAAQAARTREALRALGLTPEQVDRALGAPALPVRSLEPVDPRRNELGTVAFVGVLALYGQLFAYGYWVASGVVEEKSSRVVEVLLSTIRPSQLLRGKILGIGALGLCQLLLIAAIGLAAARATGALAFPSGAYGVIAVVLAWFLVGYFFYAGLFAVAGAIVSRQEDLQSTITPLSIVIVASFFIGISAVQDPGSTLAAVASLIPFSAPLTMPSRIVLGQSSVLEVVASATVSVGATLLLVPLATRVYSRAVLRTGRVRLRQVLRSEAR
jgi:ABC-2 type transport system permease protein